MTVVKNKKNELIPQRTITGWHVCIDYRKLNNTTWKDHFPISFIEQMLERLAGHEYYCFLDRFTMYFHIRISLEDQNKTTFTYPYGTFAYKQMPFGLCNAPATFQRCMTAIFHELIMDSMEVFMDNFSVFSNSFNHYLKNLEKMLKICEETNLVLNYEKCHFMVKEGIVLSHKVSGSRIELENPDLGKLTKAEIRDLFPEEQLMAVFNHNNEPWYIDYANYLDTKHKEYWAIKNCNMDLMKAGANRFLQINEMDELRLDAYESSISYKERTKRWHDKWIKTLISYEKGDKILLFNSRLRLFPRKLKSRW
uniref:RNA-directed DNA polymerase homolog n=1 Tax=Tanacetum cinerariifolium TaxID=118510 RepID=A0A6L2NRB9_TANCI|nr:RNA-directed DNA polymerase homolog [Tanacetum cinerariifolium]